MGKIKLNSKDIISARENCDKTIAKYWGIITSENIISKKAKAAGLGSGLDLKELYNKILQLSQQRIKLKMMLNMINNNITDYSKLDKTTNNYTIYAACEAKELKAKWQIILKSHTLNPIAKAKQTKSATTKIETFSKEKINALLAKIQLNINEYNTKLQKFNDETSLEIDSDTLNTEFNGIFTT